MSIAIHDADQQPGLGLPPLPPARPDLRLVPDASLPSDRRRSTVRRSTASGLRDPVIRAEIHGDPRVRAGRGSVSDGDRRGSGQRYNNGFICNTNAGLRNVCHAVQCI